MYRFAILLCILVLISQSSCQLYRHGHVPHTKARIDWPTHHKRGHHQHHHHQDKLGYWQFKKWRNSFRVIPHYRAVEMHRIAVAYPRPGQQKFITHPLASMWRMAVSVGDSTRNLPGTWQPTELTKQ